MNIEKQVCSLDLAKRLKKLGVKQESHFFWWATGYSGEGGLLGSKRDAERHEANEAADAPGANSCYDPVSAFTSAELGELLPTEINVPLKSGRPRAGNHRITYAIWPSSYEGSYQKPSNVRRFKCGLNHNSAMFYHNEIDDRCEANARAKMLIYLLENELIKPPSRQ